MTKNPKKSHKKSTKAAQKLEKSHQAKKPIQPKSLPFLQNPIDQINQRKKSRLQAKKKMSARALRTTK
jgi:hypothetical protein